MSVSASPGERKPADAKRRGWLRKAIGYAVIGTVWGVLLALLGLFALSYFLYCDLKSPQHSRWAQGTRFEETARLLYRRQFKGWHDDPARAQFDPELIYAPTPGTARFRSPEFDTSITMTAEGVRQQPGRADASPDGAIVMVGDSYTMGWGVNDAETFPAILEQRYGHRTINTGVSSYATAREMLRLRRLGLLPRAKMLVIQYCPNDAPENHGFLETSGQEFGRVNREERWKVILKERAKIIPDEVSYFRVLRGFCVLVREDAQTRALLTSFTPPPPEAPWSYETVYPEVAAEFLAVLDRFPEIAGKPIIVTELKAIDASSTFLADLARRAQGRTDVHIVPLVVRPEDYFRFDSHLNARGNEHVAEQLDRAIRAVEEGMALKKTKL